MSTGAAMLWQSISSASSTLKTSRVEAQMITTLPVFHMWTTASRTNGRSSMPKPASRPANTDTHAGAAASRASFALSTCALVKIAVMLILTPSRAKRARPRTMARRESSSPAVSHRHSFPTTRSRGPVRSYPECRRKRPRMRCADRERRRRDRGHSLFGAVHDQPDLDISELRHSRMCSYRCEFTHFQCGPIKLSMTHAPKFAFFAPKDRVR